jgi:hypothetical membrane protein
MNAAFVMVGLLTATGAVLTRAVPPRRRVTTVGVAFVVLAGVGAILVGLAPANVNLAAHGAGALLQVPDAVGPLLLGVAARSTQRPVAAFSLLCGVVGSAASLLYFSQVYLGLGLGDMEHLAFDPLTVRTTVLGWFCSDAGWRHPAPPPGELGTDVLWRPSCLLRLSCRAGSRFTNPRRTTAPTNSPTPALSNSRSLLGFPLRSCRDGRSGALRMGIRNGASYVGRCWALMATLFALDSWAQSGWPLSPGQSDRKDSSVAPNSDLRDRDHLPGARCACARRATGPSRSHCPGGVMAPLVRMRP